MKHLFFLLTLILAIQNINGQVLPTVDSIYLGDETLGYVHGPVTRYEFQTELSYRSFELRVFRDITMNEERIIVGSFWELLRSHDTSDIYTKVEVVREYRMMTSTSIAGRMIYESGNLKNLSNNFYLAAGTFGTLGMLASVYLERGENITYISIPLSVALTAAGIWYSYKANQKLKEAGIHLQKRFDPNLDY